MAEKELARTGTMAITVEEGMRFIGKAEIPKLARAGTMVGRQF